MVQAGIDGQRFLSQRRREDRKYQDFGIIKAYLQKVIPYTY